MCSLILTKGDQQLAVSLTPSCFLHGESLIAREEFEKYHCNSTGIKLIHESNNRYDSLAVAVYRYRVCIGYIQKKFKSQNRSLEIEKFLFTEGVNYLGHVLVNISSF